MQQGMLYDTIQSSRPGMYCIAVSYRIAGPLDAPALFAAWTTVIARHPILRTSFHWRDRSEPVQVVHHDVTLPVAEDDWQALTPEEQQQRLTALLLAEHDRGFDVAAPPLMRLTLVRCGPDHHELVVAHHHLLLDGSCKPLLFGEVFACYEAIRRGQPFDAEPPQPYRRYIQWLGEQDLRAAETFWQNELHGFAAPTPLWSEARRDSMATRDYDEHQVELDEQATRRLRQFAQASRLTLNTLVCGAWALLLASSSKRGDVVFGATVNARPAALDGVEMMLGLFINTLPVRVRIAPTTGVAEWLRTIQLQQMSAREFDFAPLSAIQRWSDVPRRLALFESILVFENNPGYGSDSERHGSVAITNVQAHIRNSLPLTLRCVPGRRLGMQVLYETARFSPETIANIAEDLLRVLNDMASDALQPVGGLTATLSENEQRRIDLQANVFQQALRDKLSRRSRGRERNE